MSTFWDVPKQNTDVVSARVTMLAVILTRSIRKKQSPKKAIPYPRLHASASSVVYLLVAPTVIGLGSYELSLRTCSSLQPRLFRYSFSLCTAQQCLSDCSCPKAGCNATEHCSYTARA